MKLIGEEVKALCSAKDIEYILNGKKFEWQCSPEIVQ
jgi:hypothetical protein